MRLLSASIAAVALLAAAIGCGSSQGGETATQGQSGTTTQTRSGEGAGSSVPTAPAGAAARSCTPSEAGVSGLRVSGTDCAAGRAIAAAWSAQSSCWSPRGASRHSCRIEGWLCGSAAAGSGEAVSCARPGRSVAFLARR